MSVYSDIHKYIDISFHEFTIGHFRWSAPQPRRAGRPRFTGGVKDLASYLRTINIALQLYAMRRAIYVRLEVLRGTHHVANH